MTTCPRTSIQHGNAHIGLPNSRHLNASGPMPSKILQAHSATSQGPCFTLTNRLTSSPHTASIQNEVAGKARNRRKKWWGGLKLQPGFLPDLSLAGKQAHPSAVAVYTQAARAARAPSLRLRIDPHVYLARPLALTDDYLVCVSTYLGI